MVVSISTGHDERYLLGAVAAGRESYYLDATTGGEPKGRWWGSGAAAFGMTGEVQAQDMQGLFGAFADPRDPAWREAWAAAVSAAEAEAEAVAVAAREAGDASAVAAPVDLDTVKVDFGSVGTLGAAPGRYRSPDAIVREKLAAKPDALPEEVAAWRASAEKQARSPVAFIDMTFGVPKSVTVIHTAFHRAELDARRDGDDAGANAWAAKRLAVESAVWAGNDAMLTAVSEVAGQSRAGGDRSGRATRYVDAPDWVVASFFQHDSRNHDPHLHIHNAILNRVLCPDGKVRTLDSRAIHFQKQYAGAVAERVMFEALADAGIGSAMRPDGKAREVLGVPQEAIDLFSGQSRKLSARAEEMAQALREQLGVEELNPLQVTRIRQQAEFATRSKKSHEGELRPQMLDRWDQDLRREVGTSLTAVAHQFEVLKPVPGSKAEKFSPSGVVKQALAEVQTNRSAWTRPELIRRLDAQLPDRLGMDGPSFSTFINQLADVAVKSDLVVQATGRTMTAAVPDVLRRASGVSVYDSAKSYRYVTRDHLEAEEALRQASFAQGYPTVPRFAVDGWLDRVDHGLNDGQRAALRGIATSAAAITVVVAGAGTGKTYTAAALDTMLGATTGGRVIGLTISENAAQVLRREGLATSINTSRWLAAQRRIDEADNRPTYNKGGKQTNRRPDDDMWRLSNKDILVVDEASMADTATLTRVRAVAEKVGCKVVLLGDVEQLGAVAAGGVMHLLANDARTFTLTEVRRFKAGWERDTSMRLRSGDSSAVDEYNRRGRIYAGGGAQATRAEIAKWLVADRLAGCTTVGVASTNEEAALISAEVRARLVAAGRVEATGVELGMEGTVAGRGDIIACRNKNNYEIGVLNRRQYEVLDHSADGLRVRALDGSGERVIPLDWARENATLGYAGTVHSVQGLTVERCRAMVDDKTDRRALYVMLSRATDANTAHVVTQATREFGGDPEELTPTAVVRQAVERESEDLSAMQVAADYRDHLKNMQTIMAYIEDGTRVAGRARTDRMLDDLQAEGVLSRDDRVRLAVDDGTEYLSRVLRAVEQAGRDPMETLREAVQERALGDANSVAQVLSHRIMGDAKVEPQPVEAERCPVGFDQQSEAYLSELHEISAERRRELGAIAAQEPPPWALEAFGPAPEEIMARAVWEQQVGTVAAQRESKGWENDEVAMAPRASTSSTEQRALDHAAWLALGKPDAFVEEESLSDGALRNRVIAAYRARQWAPAHVDEELEATTKVAAVAERDAALDATEVNTSVELEVVEELAKVATSRERWTQYVQTMEDVKERAAAELARRGEPAVGAEPDRQTPSEWLESHEHVDPEVVTEADVVDPEREVAGTPAVDDTPARSVPQVQFESSVPTASEADEAVAAAHEWDTLEADLRSQDAALEAGADTAEREETLEVNDVPIFDYDAEERRRHEAAVLARSLE